MKTSPTRAQWALIVALTLAAAPYFVRLGASSLWDANEAFYAETPREMLESGDYVNPTFNYRPRLNKPPLSYWAVVPFYKIFGVSEAAERLAIALGAMVMIATAYGLGRVLFSVDAGLLAAICLAIAPRFLMFARRIMIDVYAAMFMVLALLMYVLAERWSERRRLFLTLMYICAGLGVITKGPVAALLPAIAIIISLAVNRRLSKLRELMLPAGFIIVAAIVLPWYVAIYSQHGWTDIESFILKDNLSRYAEQTWGPRRGFFFYVPVVLGDLFPWSVFLLAALWFAVRGIWVQKRDESRPDFVDGSSSERASVALMWSWIAVIVVFFSFSRSKEDLYVLPIYPAAAALVGGAVSGFIKRERHRVQSLMRWTTLTVATFIATAGAGVLYVFAGDTQPYQLAGAGVIGWVAIVGGLTSVVAALGNRRITAVLGIAVTTIVCNWIFVLRTLPDFERFKPVRPLCEVIAAQAGPNALVGYYKTAYPSMAFYLRRPVFESYQSTEIESAFASGKEVFCLMAASDFEALRAVLPGETRVLASLPIFQVKLKGILDRVEPPRVVLISNKGGSSVEQ